MERGALFALALGHLMGSFPAGAGGLLDPRPDPPPDGAELITGRSTRPGQRAARCGRASPDTARTTAAQSRYCGPVEASRKSPSPPERNPATSRIEHRDGRL